MPVTRITPSSIRLPETSPHRRQFAPQRDHPLDLHRCDEHTLLYDAVYDRRSKKLNLLAPSLKGLLPRNPVIDVKIDNKQRWAAFKKRFRISLARLKARSVPSLIDLDFGLGDTSPSSFKPTVSLPPVPLTLSTLQKDNPIIWIEDWISYHSKLGVDRFLIYDNGSQNVEDLVARLNQLAQDIYLIDWPFEYGDTRHPRTLLAQRGALMHATLLSRAGQWLGNFDIDEYLMVKSGRLHDVLPRNPLVGSLIVQNYIMPNTVGASQTRRAADFIWREKQKRGRDNKYWLRLSGNPIPGVHRANLSFPFRTKTAPLDDLHFLHLFGLNAGYDERKRGRLDAVTPQPDKHVEDRRLKSAFTRKTTT